MHLLIFSPLTTFPKYEKKEDVVKILHDQTKRDIREDEVNKNLLRSMRI